MYDLTESRPIYSLIMGTQVMIVLSSDRAVRDLLDKRSANYSSRPEMYLANAASNWLKPSLLVNNPPSVLSVN